MTEDTMTLPATNGRRPRGRAVPDPAPAPPTLRFEVPGPDEPGFIRRQKEALRHLDIMRGRRRDELGNPDPASEADMDNLLAFLLRFVAEPEDRDQAHEMLLDITRAEYFKLLNAITQESNDFL